MSTEPAPACAIPAERGCGRRKQGGVYAECGLSEGGRPVEDYLFDPPILLPIDLDIAPLGVQLIERNGVTHIVDWIGTEYYPNVADFVEEVRQFGLSRRLPKNLDFGRITKQSRILLIHARAWINNVDEYGWWECLTERQDHEPETMVPGLAALPPAQRCCSGIWWYDLQPESDTTPASPLNPRIVNRHMPSFTYLAKLRPPGVKPLYMPAFFAAFPMSRLVVVDGADAARTYEAMQAAHVPVAVVDE